MNPGEARERLCHYVYRTLEPGNHLGLVQQALELAIAAEPLEKKIRVEGVKTGEVTALDLPGQIREALAAGIITEAEAAQLREYDRKVMEIIHVDDFESHELAAGGTRRRPRRNRHLPGRLDPGGSLGADARIEPEIHDGEIDRVADAVRKDRRDRLRPVTRYRMPSSTPPTVAWMTPDGPW